MTPHIQPLKEHEQSRRTAYAAVTAHFAGDSDLIVDLVYELTQQPEAMVGALLAMIQACAATTELWAKATYEEPAKAWAAFAETVACEATRMVHTCGEET